MMRFLLVNPYYPVSETPSPPLGLAFLAAALEAADIEVRLLDFVVFPYSKNRLQKVLARFEPHMIGVTAVSMNVDSALAVIRDAKALAPDARTVMGGPHVTFCARETMTANEALDFIVLGEGEETIVELCRALQHEKPLDTVRGLVHRSGYQIITNGPRPFIADIDALPEPARHLIPLGRYRALGMPISITTSRGCPFQCIFCTGRKMVGAKVRYRSPLRVVDELVKLSKLDFHQINIADDLFTASRKHCLAVCDEIIQRGLKIPWTSFARVDTISLEMLRRMREAGCTAVSFGIESGSPEMLKRIKKGITLEQVFEAVNLCHAAGITPQASFILGLPGETPQTLKQTVALGRRLKEMGVLHGFHLLAPFPGTDVRENLSAYDLQIMSHDWKDYHANRAIVRTAAVTQEMMNAIVIEWEHQFNLWLDDIKQRRASGQATEDEAWPLTKLEHTVLLYDLMMARALEENGAFRQLPLPETDSEAISLLIDRLEGSVHHSRDQMGRTLAYAMQRGYLSFTRKNGNGCWRWADYL